MRNEGRPADAKADEHGTVTRRVRGLGAWTGNVKVELAPDKGPVEDGTVVVPGKNETANGLIGGE